MTPFHIPCETPNKARIIGFALFCALVYFGSLAGLCFAWYQFDNNSSFHWFDDSTEWLLMDKLGHAFTTYVEIGILQRLWWWTGLPKRQSLWWSIAIAYVSQCSYEVFDGFSKGYGASIYDILFNTIGILLFIIQQKLSGLFAIKLSFWASPYAIFRPNMLGENIIQQFLKDYNGQKYWFNINLHQWLKVWPKWLLLSVGYGAEGLLGGTDNVWTDNQGHIHDFSHIARANKIYLSLDIDWHKLSHPAFKFPYELFRYIKLPAPALELNLSGSIKFHWILF